MSATVYTFITAKENVLDILPIFIYRNMIIVPKQFQIGFVIIHDNNYVTITSLISGGIDVCAI